MIQVRVFADARFINLKYQRAPINNEIFKATFEKLVEICGFSSPFSLEEKSNEEDCSKKYAPVILVDQVRSRE